MAPFAYVTNNGSGSVSVIDTAAGDTAAVEIGRRRQNASPMERTERLRI
jgi:DNA-binding beta-propeller fold protein YncE